MKIRRLLADDEDLAAVGIHSDARGYIVASETPMAGPAGGAIRGLDLVKENI